MKDALPEYPELVTVNGTTTTSYVPDALGMNACSDVVPPCAEDATSLPALS